MTPGQIRTCAHVVARATLAVRRYARGGKIGVIKIAFSSTNLAQQMAKCDLTARQIATELGHPNTTRLYRYRNGRMLPQADTIAKLASILGCHPQDLLAEVEVEG